MSSLKSTATLFPPSCPQYVPPPTSGQDVTAALPVLANLVGVPNGNAANLATANLVGGKNLGTALLDANEMISLNSLGTRSSSRELAPAESPAPIPPNPDLTAEELAEEHDDPDADASNQEVALLTGRSPRVWLNQLINELKASKDRTRWGFGEKGSALAYLHDVARLAMRIHGPYITISQALTMGLAICTAKDPDNVTNRRASINCDPETLDQYVELARWLLEMAPFLHEFLPALDEDREAVMLLSQSTTMHVRDAQHSSALSRPKSAAGSRQLGSRFRLVKTWRGNPLPAWTTFTQPNPMAPLMLTEPTEDGIVAARHEFDKNLNEFMQGLCNGNIKMNEMGFPLFLYSDGTRPISSDAKDFLIGLCEGDLLMSGYRCVWTSPGSALLPAGASSGGRASISRTHGINCVQGGSIAYIAVLMRHILSSEVDWNHQSFKTFNGEAFFHRIVQLFKCACFATPVLARFQKYVYGTGPDSNTPDTEITDQLALVLEYLEDDDTNGIGHKKRAQLWGLWALPSAHKHIRAAHCFADAPNVDVRALERLLQDGSWPQEAIEGVFNKNVAIAYPNFKFLFTIWMLGRAHWYLEELRGAQSVNGNGKANCH
ncbi:hypothetical protein BC628DRAFT_1448543 [Trametes gibbosa]|nr:hypothetical protein BC628DRAFT_1448543 [Trametes gibbosa]